MSETIKEAEPPIIVPEIIEHEAEAILTPKEVIAKAMEIFNKAENVPRDGKEIVELIRVTFIEVSKAELNEMILSDKPIPFKTDLMKLGNEINLKWQNAIRDIDYLNKNGLSTEGDYSERKKRCQEDETQKAEKIRDSEYRKIADEYDVEIEGLSIEDVIRKIKLISEDAFPRIEQKIDEAVANNSEEEGIYSISDLLIDKNFDDPDNIQKIFEEARKLGILRI